LGATHVIPRSVPLSSLSSEVAKITSEPVEIVFDSISLAETQLAGIDVLAPNGTIVVLLAPTQDAKDKAGAKEFGHVFGSFSPPATRSMGHALAERLPTYIADGLLKVYSTSNWLLYYSDSRTCCQPNRVQILPGGLAGIEKGLDMLENNEVSGMKLIVRPQETA
jgi:hypothetical protein